MKNTFLLLMILLSTVSFSQTTTKSFIYEQGRTTMSELDNGMIFISYQNIKYKHILELDHFNFKNSKDAIEYFKEAIRVLNMDKTKKDQDIRHTVHKVEMIRFGFSQKNIYLNGTFVANEKYLKKYISALENYPYTSEVNKS